MSEKVAEAEAKRDEFWNAKMAAQEEANSDMVLSKVNTYFFYVYQSLPSLPTVVTRCSLIYHPSKLCMLTNDNEYNGVEKIEVKYVLFY